MPTESTEVDEVPVPRPPLTTTTSIKPAASVLVIAVVMLVIFILINALFDSNTTSTTTTVAVVGGLAVDTTSALMDGCKLPDNPPSDIASALIVPVDTVAAGVTNLRNASPGAYDCSRSLSATHSESQILGFYLHQLEGLGWRTFSTAPAANGGGEQYLFQKAGSDTFYWIAGVTVNAHGTNSAVWTLRVYQDNSLT